MSGRGSGEEPSLGGRPEALADTRMGLPLGITPSLRWVGGMRKQKNTLRRFEELALAPDSMGDGAVCPHEESVTGGGGW